MLQLFLALLAFITVLALIKQAQIDTIMHVSHRVSGKPHVGIWLYALVFFPGTLLHELSHALIAELVRVKTGDITLFPKHESQYVRLGSVSVVGSDPFRGLLIGSAPFLFGLLGVTILVMTQFSSLQTAPFSLMPVVSEFIAKLQDPLVWFVLYLLLVISHAMFPSEADRKELYLVPIAAIIIAVGAYFLHAYITLPDWILAYTTQALTLVTISIGAMIVFNFAILIVLLILRKVIETLF